MNTHSHTLTSVNEIPSGTYRPSIQEQLGYVGAPLYRQEYPPMSMEATIATERRQARERARVEALYASFAEPWVPDMFPLIADWHEGDYYYAAVRSPNGKWTISGSAELFADDHALVDEFVRRGLNGDMVRMRPS